MSYYRSFRGLRSLPGDPQAVMGQALPQAPLVRANMDRQIFTVLNQHRSTMRAALAPRVPGGGSAATVNFTAPATQERCDCIINKFDAHVVRGGGDPLTWDAREQLLARCGEDFTTFVQVLTQELGLSRQEIDNCMPWYQRRMVWAIGGLATLGLVGVAVFTATRKRGRR